MNFLLYCCERVQYKI